MTERPSASRRLNALLGAAMIAHEAIFQMRRELVARDRSDPRHVWLLEESARRWMQRAWWRQECRRVGHGIKQRIRARYGDDAVFDRVVNSGDRGLDHLQGKWEELGCGRP